VTNSTIVSLGF